MHILTTRAEAGVTMLEVALLVSLISVVAIAGIKASQKAVLLTVGDSACAMYHQNTNGHGSGYGNIQGQGGPVCHCRTNNFAFYRPLKNAEILAAKPDYCS